VSYDGNTQLGFPLSGALRKKSWQDYGVTFLTACRTTNLAKSRIHPRVSIPTKAVARPGSESTPVWPPMRSITLRTRGCLDRSGWP